MSKIRVLIADDHAVVRDGLRILLSTEPDLEVAGEAKDGESAVRMARQLKPNVVIMDVAMPRVDGVKAAQDIFRNSPNSKVLVLSAYSDADSVQKLVEAGAAGYLTKQSAAEDLLHAIREVNRGHTFFSPSIVHRFQGRQRHAFLTGQRLALPNQLTAREKEVLTCIAQGLSNKQIASALQLSIKTVEKHRQAVMDKLDIHDIAGLTRYAVSKAIIPLPRVQPPPPAGARA